MKQIQKIGVVSLLTLFLALTIGIPLQKHFCGASLSAVGIGEQDCCCESGELAVERITEASCCRNEAQFFLLDTEFVKNNVNFVFVGLRAQRFFKANLQHTSKKAFVEVLNTKPKPVFTSKKIPIYKRLNKLIFYA